MTEENPRRRNLVEGSVLVGVAGVIYVADQVTKALVVANLPVGSRTDVVGDLVQIWHAQNRGAAFSLLQDSQVLFLVVSAIALVTIAYFFRSLHGRSLWLYAILGLVLGGTLGNLTDRIRQQYVTDFLSVGHTRRPLADLQRGRLLDRGRHPDDHRAAGRLRTRR